MSRPIDADALAEIFIDRMGKVKERFGFNSSEAGIISGAYKLLQSQPTIVPQPIIRCKDCKHWKSNEFIGNNDVFTINLQSYPCKNWLTSAEWYCANAERKQDDGVEHI